MARVLKSRYLVPMGIGLLLTLGAILVKTTEVPLLSDLDRRLEWLAYDLRLRLLLPESAAPDPRIVIMDIDEQSLLELGRWPWSRSTVADLVERVFEDGAAVLAMDVVFAEPQRSDLGELLDSLDPEVRDLILADVPLPESIGGGDQRLAESLQGRNVVLGYAIADITSLPKGTLPPPLVMDEWLVESLDLVEMESYIANLERLQDKASGGGFFSVIPDDDGVIRRAPLLARRNAHLYGSLALETVRRYLDAGQLLLKTAPIGDYQVVEAVSLDGVSEIRTDDLGYVLVPYRGRSGSFSYVSSADVYNGTVPEGTFRDKIVLFGTTAVGLYDMRSTPVESVFPGVEVHANVIAGLLDGQFPYEPPWAPGANVALLAGIGLLSVFIVPFIGPVAILLISLVLLLLVAGLNIWLWSAHGLVLAIVAPLLLVIAIGAFDLAYGFLAEARGRRQLKAIFGQYVPPEIVNEMNRNPDGDFAVEGESRELSVLFCDIRGFTTISEMLAADELKQMLNYFFTPMTRIIFERRGTIDKYVGDMIMAFWGAPVIDPEHHRHAVLAALEMLDTLAGMQPAIRERGWPQIDIGIGINSGLMNVGDMGSEYRRAYTVIGDAVNLGSRLEGLTKYYGVRLIVSESTAAGLNGIVLRCLDRVQVKGKNEPVTIYEPVGAEAGLSVEARREIDDSNRALEYYFAGDWGRAEPSFQALHEAAPECLLYGLYLDRIRTLKAQGIGTGWDGVFRHTSK
ncbi:MAG: adenylate/guanylate cyclase domain-containing protein [Gammaproteobacteria bacterium]